jgi:general L-amino acid transport system permease protein
MEQNILKIWNWCKSNLFSSVFNSILTLVSFFLLYLIIPPAFGWFFTNAVWVGTVEDCRAATGACWPVVSAKIGFFTYGFYPEEQRWRVNIVFAILAFCITWLVIDRTPGKKNVIIFTLFIFPVISFVLLTGSLFKFQLFPAVASSNWGGLLLTFIIGIVGIVFSLPCGIILALGRRSQLPLIKSACVVFIEFWRGVPLITVLFMASVMLPLFFGDVKIAEINRALIGFAMFSSAYMAEVIKGGLQGMSKGQFEGADSLGLNYFQKMRLVILPQALTIVIPGIVNTFIGLFKDTTLVLIIALTDFLGSVQTGIADPKWSSPSTAFSGYAFTAIVFFVLCYGMSLYSKKVEKKLNKSKRN